MANQASQLIPGSDTCPWCGVTVSFYRYQAMVSHHRKDRRGNDIQDGRGGSGAFQWTVITQYCPACGCPHIVVHAQVRDGTEIRSEERIVYPLAHGRPPTPTEVPKCFSDDYDEACAVLPVSPQSSAALSRRLLQALLRGPGQVQISSTNLHDEINAARPGLPPLLWEQLHLLRTIGNFAAHPIKDATTGAIQPVEVGEAEFSLSVIEELFELFFVAPKRVSDAKAALNAKLLAAKKQPLP